MRIDDRESETTPTFRTREDGRPMAFLLTPRRLRDDPRLIGASHRLIRCGALRADADAG